MSKKANPALIGGFVIGAVALLVIFVLVFGSGRLFRDIAQHVVYFEGSISGLRAGANVNFRGVRIGEVTGVRVVYDESDLSFQVPVTIEIDNNRLTVVDVVGEELPPREELKSLVENGLRAQLNVQSFVTGLLEIQLDFFPDSEVVYRGEGFPYEIPTIPSTAQVLAQKVQKFITEVQDWPLDKLVADVTSAAAGLDALLNSPDTQALPGSLRRSLRSFEQTVTDAREEFTGPSELRHRVSVALDELAAAARAARVLADYLERHPESLLRGRQNP